MIDYRQVIGHLEGRTDPRRTPGFNSCKQAARVGRRLLDRVWRIDAGEDEVDGPLVLGCLRTFHAAHPAKSTKQTHREQRALAEVFVQMCERDKVPCLSANALADAFAEGREQDARHRAAEFYADCALRLDGWLGE